MTQDTSTEAVERLAKHHDLLHPKVETVTLFAKTSEETAGVLRALTAERDTLAKQAEDCARTCAEQAEEIQTLTGQLAEAGNAALEEAASIADNWKADAIKGELLVSIVERIATRIRALKSEPAPRPKSKAVPSSAPVEVCGICDIAGCHHTRELNEKMPNEIAAWPTFPDGCVTGSWSANQHHQDAIAYVRKEPATRQSVQEAARVLLNAPRSTTGPLAHAGRVAEMLLEDVECGGEITTEIIEAFLRALAQEATDQ